MQLKEWLESERVGKPVKERLAELIILNDGGLGLSKRTKLNFEDAIDMSLLYGIILGFGLALDMKEPEVLKVLAASITPECKLKEAIDADQKVETPYSTPV